jgi:uncharacterized protein YjcR
LKKNPAQSRLVDELAARACSAAPKPDPANLVNRQLFRKRCRMHGGAQGSGAPRGNKNALKHGLYTERRQVSELMRQSRKLLLKIE